MDMSTPPPPTYAAAPPPLSPEPAQPRLSETARIVDTFIAPRKTFEDVRVNSSWWVPWLVTTILSVLFGAIAAQKIDMLQFTRHQIEQSKMRQRQMEQLPPEQQERQIAIGAAVTKVFFYISPVVALIIGVVIAAALMAVFNFGFAAEVTFSQALAIVFYSFLPRAILALLLGISLLVASDPNSIDIAGNPMPTNFGFFMDPQGNKFFYSLVSNLDLFALWTVVLLGLGFAAVSKNRKLTAGTAITTMFVIYGVVTLISAGVKSAF
jgi:hypothetical protein